MQSHTNLSLRNTCTSCLLPIHKIIDHERKERGASQFRVLLFVVLKSELPNAEKWISKQQSIRKKQIGTSKRLWQMHVRGDLMILGSSSGQKRKTGIPVYKMSGQFGHRQVFKKRQFQATFRDQKTQCQFPLSCGSFFSKISPQVFSAHGAVQEHIYIQLWYLKNWQCHKWGEKVHEMCLSMLCFTKGKKVIPSVHCTENLPLNFTRKGKITAFLPSPRKLHCRKSLIHIDVFEQKDELIYFPHFAATKETSLSCVIQRSTMNKCLTSVKDNCENKERYSLGSCSPFFWQILL